MKTVLLSLLPLIACAAETADLGNVMCVGDSLTHGVNAASWRWALHKILVDNGISYKETGIKTGNDSGGVSPGTCYRGVAFQNVHAAQASAHAREISGRVAGPRFSGTHIENWLGLETAMANGRTYSGAVCQANTFFLLVGTNDLLGMQNLGETEEAIRADAERKYSWLLGEKDSAGTRCGSWSNGEKSDVQRIVDAVFAASPQASFAVFSIPAWTIHNRYNINTPAAHESVAAYNAELQKWVGFYNATHGVPLLYVDINGGLADVTADVPMTGVHTMFNCPGKDGLHPNAQGDLLIAGAVAQARGFGGRTAGLERRDACAFSRRAASTVSLNPGEASRIDWDNGADFSGGFSVELLLPSGLGNGAANGWDTCHNFSVRIGNGSVSGTLNINEAYICWGETILYSADMSGDAQSKACTVYNRQDAIRIAYVPGDAAAGIPSGFYVWLGDRLIGEACPAQMDDFCAVTMANNTQQKVELPLPAAETRAYAPPCIRCSVQQ